ncbi:uncharacterized protein LOC126883234 [Diabrotica virgifera virgifera]|uniref:Uncharacterized protein n=1 Tax=Diabrotica virgifera virgifera TaxID=50390 RepID=A0ABM5K2Q8_DIAVI|nr:uncharacterized protein LOC126883234 [Diabrotica virgifera virgifera]
MASCSKQQENNYSEMDREDSLERVKKITRMELYTIIKDFKGNKIEEKFSLLEERVAQLTLCPSERRSVLTRSLKYFKTSFKKRWSAARNTDRRFLENNMEWLNVSLELPTWTHKAGRPTKEFGELCDRSKRRRTKDLRHRVPFDELTYAASVSHGTAGNVDVSKVMKEITSTPTRAKKFRKAISSAKKEPIAGKYTPQEALALFIEGNFTRRQWELIQGGRKEIYPCYSILQKAKKECYPAEDSIQVTETSFEVELQALLNHTTLRLLQYLTEVIDTLSEFEKQHLTLISKWGCDGSNQTQFKQKFANTDDDDANIFLSSLVPVRMVVFVNGETRKIVWQNPVPSSVRFCRPIRARFIHETKDITKEEISYIEQQARNLKETTGMEDSVKINHTILFTMVDGKVCNAATDTASTMRCYICGQTSKDFNKLERGNVCEESLRFGLSILHARIRFFELLLHLAYKAPLQKWQARTAEEKHVLKETKQKIPKSFKEEMGLLVDIPKVGYGNSNDGNTSRRFFNDPECSSRITGINLDLIKRFQIILEVISSGYDIDPSKFDYFAHTTAKLYVELYGWHPMSPTVHKILTHGAQVISSHIVPIGQLSEEAAEARNKHFRKYRVDFARKFSRVDCNRDVLNRLLLTSDPFISCSRINRKKKSKSFSQEAISMLLTKIVNCDSSNDEDDENQITCELGDSDSD